MLSIIKYAFFGALIFQMVFIFILYLQNQKKPYYIYYSLYVLGILLAMKPDLLQIRNAFVYLVEWPAMMVYFLFLESFLNISRHSKLYGKFMRYLIPGVLFFMIVQTALTVPKEFYGPMDTVDWLTKRLEDVFFFLIYLSGAYAIVETYRLKNTLSRYILAGTFFLLLGVILNKMFFETLNVSSIIIGTFLELLLFSAAIGYKTNLNESEKRKAQEQLTQTTLMALRDQMSPHFIANCLNSIKHLIQQNKDKEAIYYLTEFSKLHRLIVEHFQSLKISLEKELNICRTYLAMEQLRFKQPIDYEFDIQVDDNLLSFVEIPPLLFQPIIENAIWHGLIKKEGEKRLLIRIEGKESHVKCTIEDNGVGRPKHSMNGSPVPQTFSKKSTGIANTQEKIELFNEMYHTRLNMELIDKFDDNNQPDGLSVVFTIFYD